MSNGARLDLIELTKNYGNAQIVKGIDLTIEPGEFFALLGSSGCGKTTTLRMLAGLEKPSSGSIRLDGEEISHLPPAKRPVNTVFQSYALFPHLSVRENVAFGLRRARAEHIDQRVDEMLALVQLESRAESMPSALSGGQKQRVAVARALINEPRALLLDEPLGALDLRLRHQMQVELKRMQSQLGLTFVHVTHDQEEAMSMADRIAVMRDGRIEQLGTPRELYDSPRSTFVAQFLGSSNLFPATRGDGAQITVLDRQTELPKQRIHSTASTGVMGVRPERVRLSSFDSGATPSASDAISLSGSVSSVVFQGSVIQYEMRAQNGTAVMAIAQNEQDRVFGVGDPVIASWSPESAFYLASEA